MNDRVCGVEGCEAIVRTWNHTNLLCREHGRQAAKQARKQRDLEAAEQYAKELWEETLTSLERDPSRWEWKTLPSEHRGPDKGLPKLKSAPNPYLNMLPDGLNESLWDWSWRKEAACVEEDPELFYKPGGARDYQPEQLQKAKSICASCPVRQQCLAASMAITGTMHDHGIWGGLTEDERQALRNRRCLVCGKSLEGMRHDARHCSVECQSRTNNQRKQQRAQLLLEQQRMGRVCEGCGGQVPITRKTGKWMVTCSVRCYQRVYQRDLQRMKRAAAKRQQEAVV